VEGFELVLLRPAVKTPAGFYFRPELVMTFGEESEAKQAVEALRDSAEIEARVVKIS
jgi:hypothetical protein